MFGLPSARSARLLDQDAFAPRITDFATWSDDRPALKLPPQAAQATPDLDGAFLIAPLPRRLMACRVAVPTDTGDELDHLIDLAHARVAGPQ